MLPSQAALAAYHALHLAQGVLAAVAQFNQLHGRQRAAALGRERAFAAQGIVYVDDAAQTVGPHRDAAAHVGHDEAQVFITAAYRRGVAARHGLLVEGVEHRAALQAWQPADARLGAHLVDHHRVGRICRAPAPLGQLGSYEGAQVAGMLHGGVAQVVLHALVDGVDPAAQRVQQSAAPYHCVEAQRYVGLLKPAYDEVTAIFILVGHMLKACQLAHRVMGACRPHLFVVVEDGHLRRCGTRIDYQYLHNLCNFMCF